MELRADCVFEFLQHDILAANAAGIHVLCCASLFSSIPLRFSRLVNPYS